MHEKPPEVVMTSLSVKNARKLLLSVVPEAVKIRKSGMTLSSKVSRTDILNYLAENWDEEIQSFVDAAVMRARKPT